MSILGTRVTRVEDPKLITTGGVYTEDLQLDDLDGAACLTYVRSPMAHGKVLAVDASAARAAPGVVGVWTAADLGDLAPMAPGMPMFNAMIARPWLAGDTVRYVGEPIAAVLTETRGQGADAIELVEVDLEPLPAVIGATRSARDDVLLFPGAGTNLVASFGSPEPDGFFDDCDVVVRQAILNQRLAPVPLEVRSAAASWGDDGRLTMWSSNQNAQGVQAELCRWFGLAKEQVRVRTADVGGGFGAKIGIDPESAFVAWLARQAGRPVRWTETRSESMTGLVHGRAQEQTVALGGTGDGRITAYSIAIDQDAGAYPRFGALLPMLTLMMAPAVYDIAKVNGFARSLVTNTTPIGAYRGAGRPEATAAIERAIDIFAAEIGKDPAEVRRINLLAPFDRPRDNGTGAVYDSGNYIGALDLVLEAAGYDQLRAEQRSRRDAGDVRQLGIGMSVYVEITGAATGPEGPADHADVEVHDDGTVTVLTGTSPHGQGHGTAWAMIVSDKLGIPIEKITVVHGDTDLVPRGGGTMGSRSLQQGGAAVQQASVELVELAKKRAAEILEANPDDLVVDLDAAGLVVAGTDRSITFADIAARDTLQVHSTFTADAPTFPFGAHLAVVEVDTGTGQARLQRILTVDDAGRILNPLLAEGQR
ncbi:MAG: xanthine dehydrogenase family protein molybdopterin-binding subunit, partial [Jatrophihabitantaceae bacterium]